jgi:uncharacterized membrane protein SpoIIM required for sporulation
MKKRILWAVAVLALSSYVALFVGCLIGGGGAQQFINMLLPHTFVMVPCAAAVGWWSIHRNR